MEVCGTDYLVGMTFQAVHPMTGAPGRRVASLDAPARAALLDTVAARQAAWRRLPLDARCRVIDGLAAELGAQREPLALALTDEMGKPMAAARAEVDLWILQRKS